MRVLRVLACLFAGALASPLAASAGKPAIDLTVAARYFKEAEAVCARDAGALWGRDLCGPMIFVDRATREAVANRRDADGVLHRRGGLFVGRVPADLGTANTATAWSGTRWTMVMWPLPQSEEARVRLMMHEQFHRVQDDLGFPMSGGSAPHLDSLQGRLLIQLEWRALDRALTGSGAARRAAVRDALIFRARRRALFPEAAETEHRLEMNEGLAEYTGIALAATSPDRAIAAAAAAIDRARTLPSLVRSFPYVSGPLYGLLLDRVDPGWRHGLQADDDLATLLARSLHVSLPANIEAAADARAALYDHDGLRKAEAERDAKRRAELDGYRARLVDGPVLVLPTRNGHWTFDPNNLAALPGLGTVYPTLKYTDDWGTLDVTGGALVVPKGSPRVQVAAPGDPAARPLSGRGWTLRLRPGWTVVPGPRKGDLTVVRVKEQG